MAEQVQATVRIINKHGKISEWNGENSIILMAGEIGLAEITTASDVNGEAGGKFNPPQYLAKVGDGTRRFSELNWLAAPASDVYAWAKKVALEVSDLPTLAASDSEKIKLAVEKILADNGVAGDEAVKALADRVDFLEKSGILGSNAIEVTETEVKEEVDGVEKVVGTNTNIALKLDSSAASEGKTKVELTQTPNGLKAEVVVPSAPVQSVSGDEKVITVTPTNGDYEVSATIGLKYVAPTGDANAKLVLTGIDGKDVAEMDASAFIVDGMIESAELEAGTGADVGKTFLKLTFNTAAGKEAVKVDVTTLIDVYEAGNGIDITGKTVSIKLASGSEGFLTVDASGIKLTGVQTAIDTAISDAKNELIGDDEDTAESNTIIGAKKYADSLADNYATADQGEKADTAVQDIDVDVDTGLTSERDATTNVITIKRNPDVVFILDGGTALSDTSVTA